MSSFQRKKVDPADLIVGKTYRIINQWYTYNYTNSCMEMYIGEYVRKFQINDKPINSCICCHNFSMCIISLTQSK